MEVGSAFQIRQKVLIFVHYCAKYRAIFALHINPRQKMHIPPPCGIMIAQCAIRHDSIVPHSLYRAAPLPRGLYPQPTACGENAAFGGAFPSARVV